MTFLGVFLLAVSALHLVRGSEHECIGQGVEVCLDTSGVDVSSEAKECGVVRSSIECLRGVVNEHLCEGREKKVNEGFDNLQTLLRKHCQTKERTNDTHAVSLLPKRQRRCTERKANNCLLESSGESFDSKEKKEKCQIIRSAINCLKNIGDVCLDVYSVHIKDLEKRFWRGLCDPDEEDIEDCPELLTDEFGTLYGPRYPDDYPKNKDCWTLIKVNVGKKIFLEVEVVYEDIDYWKGGYNCTSEYVEVFKGEDKNSLLLGKVCDSMYFESSNSLLLHFHSGYSSEGGTFRARYTTVDVAFPPFWEDIADEILDKNIKCVEENAGFIFKCFSEVPARDEARADFGYDSVSFHTRECGLYIQIAFCIIEKTEIECDETEEMRVKETISNLLKRDAKPCIDSEYFEWLDF